MAPFRAHTFGYTGQAKNTFRDFKFNPAYQTRLETIIQEIVKSRFKNFKTAHEVTQFIRGELFFYVDSIITIPTETTSADLPARVEFITQVFELIITWLDIFPSYVEAYKECHATPNLMLVDVGCAISQCGYELLKLLGMVFGMCRRTNNFFSDFQGDFLVEGEFAKDDVRASSGLQLSLINQFGVLGGFEKIIQMVGSSNETQFPLPLMCMCLSQFNKLQNYCQSSFIIPFAKKISQGVMKRLDNLMNAELKEIDRDVPRRMIRVLEMFILMFESPNEVYERSETYELRIAKKYLTCPYFEKRIKGMAEFKDIFNKVRNFKGQDKEKSEIVGTRFLDFAKFSKWLHDERILEFIFVESPHNELI